MPSRKKPVHEMTADEYLTWQLRQATEAQFQDWLIRLAREEGWWVHYVPMWMFRQGMASLKRRRRSDRDWPDKGFPDLVLIHPERRELVILELKRDRDSRVAEEQKVWLDVLHANGIRAHIVKPRHRALIEAILRGEG